MVAAGHPILLQAQGGLELVSPVAGAEVSGLEALNELAPGDRVHYRWSLDKAGVRLADRIAVDPVLAVDPDLDVLAGKLEQELTEGVAVVVDARPSLRWSEGRVPGALSIPADAPEPLLARIAATPKPLVLYGESGRTPEAHALFRRLVALGRSDVRILRGGIRDWEGGGGLVAMDADAVARELAARRRLVAIDVRPAEVAAADRLPGALPIPLAEGLPAEFSNEGKMPPLVVVGAAPGDADALEVAGRIRRIRADPRFERWTVRVLAGGATAWRRAKLSVAETATRGPLRLRATGSADVVGPEEFAGIVAAKGGGRLVLDVRPVPSGTPPWVKFIRLEDLAGRLAELPKDREVIVYCKSGRRASVAQALLTRNGFRARYLDGPVPRPLP